MLKKNRRSLKTYALCSYRNFRVLNGKYHLFARWDSGYMIRFKYIPTAMCDNEYLYCFVKGTYTNSVKVSELILNDQSGPENA